MSFISRFCNEFQIEFKKQEAQMFKDYVYVYFEDAIFESMIYQTLS